MKTIMRAVSSTILVLGAFLCIMISSSVAAEWTVTKVSGAVWFERSGVQKVSLGSGAQLGDGDQVTTGPNGRVMLSRGDETILVSPNSAISLPKSPSAGLTTTILQRAGSILLAVEKRNENHFEVRTPFLAAIVKGTRFTVTVSPKGAKVDVTEGRVEVADFRTGQVAMVLPGQSAVVSESAQSGLSLRGSGRFEAIRPGSPQVPGVNLLKVPSGGLTGPVGKALGQSASATVNKLTAKAGERLQKVNGRVSIKASIGETKINAAKATKGLTTDKTDRSNSFGKDKQGSFWTYDVASDLTGGGIPNGSYAGDLGVSIGQGSGGGLELGIGGDSGIGLSLGGGGIGLSLGGDDIGLGLGGGPGGGLGGLPGGLGGGLGGLLPGLGG